MSASGDAMVRTEAAAHFHRLEVVLFGLLYSKGGAQKAPDTPVPVDVGASQI